MIRVYCVAGLRFQIDDGLNLITDIVDQYAPFEAEHDNASPCLFSVCLLDDDFELTREIKEKEFVREEGEFLIRTCYYNHGRVYYEFHYKGKRSASLFISRNYDYVELKLENYRLYGLNNAIRTLYGYTALRHHAILIHASAICHERKAYLFLGKSGTGKSTHSSLWLNNIPDTELINDDVPIVRLVDGEFNVYGSPWSGKTPCYRNVSYPLGGIVRIYQAPANQIRLLSPLEAYASITPSIQGDRNIKLVADNVHAIETLMVQKIGIWSMECLPDANAARICCEAITKS